MMLGARTGAWAKRGGGVPTARDYVQDGLIAMWDGIENAGWGVHDPNATTWTELIGGETVNLSSGIEFGDDCARTTSDFSGSRWALRTEKECQHMTAVFKTSSTEIQFVILRLRTRSCIGASGSSFGIGLRQSIPANNIVGNRFSISANYATASSPTADSAYVNGVENTNRSAVNYANPVSRGTCIGGGYNSMPFFGEIFNIRLYSRALTASEIAANYAIDKARFNLPDKTI